MVTSSCTATLGCRSSAGSSLSWALGGGGSSTRKAPTAAQTAASSSSMPRLLASTCLSANAKPRLVSMPRPDLICVGGLMCALTGP